MASQLLQILQQGIQAKERAQQADIDRGLRELQIGKEESLQRDRLTFQNIKDRQFELLKLSRQISADAREQASNQMHELNLNAIDTADEFKLLEEQRRMDSEAQFQAQLATINLEAGKANTEILSGLVSGYGATALSEDTTIDLKNSIDKIFKNIDPVVGQNLYSSYQSAGLGQLQPFEDLMDYLNDNIIMSNTVLEDGDTVGLAAKNKAKGIKDAFAAMGIDVDGSFGKTWEAFLKNEQVQSNVRTEFQEMMNYDIYDEKGKLIPETDDQRRERRFSSQTDMQYMMPERKNDVYQSYQDQLDALRLLNSKTDENKKNGYTPKTHSEALSNWNEQTRILKEKQEDLKNLGVEAKASFNGDVHDIVEKTLLSIQKSNKVFKNSDWKGIVGTNVLEKDTNDKKHVQLAMQHMKKSSVDNFLGNNLMSSMEHDKLRQVFGSKSFEEEFKKQANMFLQKYPRNEYWYDNQIFGNIMPVGKGANEIKAQTRALESHANAMSFLGILKKGMTAWNAYSEQLGIQRDAFSKTGM